MLWSLLQFGEICTEEFSLCVSLCVCIFNCPRQATGEWRSEGFAHVRNVGERRGAGPPFRHAAAVSAASWLWSCQEAFAPIAVSFVSCWYAGSAQHCQQLCGQPCYKPSTKLPLFGCCYGNSTITAKLEWRWGTENNVRRGWAKSLRLFKRILSDHLDWRWTDRKTREQKPRPALGITGLRMCWKKKVPFREKYHILLLSL